MIQRIQSLYLLLAGVSLLGTAGLPLFFFSGSSAAAMTALAFVDDANGVITRPWGVAVFFLLAFVLAIVAILRYKDRKKQIFLVNYLILVIIVGCIAAVAYGLAFASQEQCSLEWSNGMLLPVVACVLSVLARRGIRKDEELVRAADRIR